jgi:hypothetical protein
VRTPRRLWPRPRTRSPAAPRRGRAAGHYFGRASADVGRQLARAGGPVRMHVPHLMAKRQLALHQRSGQRHAAAGLYRPHRCEVRAGAWPARELRLARWPGISTMSGLPEKRRLNDAPLSSETLSPSPGARMISQTRCSWVRVNRSGIRCRGKACSPNRWPSAERAARNCSE